MGNKPSTPPPVDAKSGTPVTPVQVSRPPSKTHATCARSAHRSFEPQTASGSSAKDQAMSDEPLYVLYGGPECTYCVQAADVLMQTQRHHVKIGGSTR